MAVKQFSRIELDEETQFRYFLDDLDTDTDVPAEDTDYSFEEIMAEFGGGLERWLTAAASEMEADLPQPAVRLEIFIEPPPVPEPPREEAPPEMPEAVSEPSPEPEAVQESVEEPVVLEEKSVEEALPQTEKAPVEAVHTEETPEEAEEDHSPEAPEMEEEAPEAEEPQTETPEDEEPSETEVPQVEEELPAEEPATEEPEAEREEAAEATAEEKPTAEEELPVVEELPVQAVEPEAPAEEARKQEAPPEEAPPQPSLWTRLGQAVRGRFTKPSRVPETPEEETPPMPAATVEDVVGSTVDAVMADRCRYPRRTLFSRRPMEDTEILGPEPDLAAAAERYRAESVRRSRGQIPALCVALIPTLVLLAEQFLPGFMLLEGFPEARGFLLLLCLGVELFLCRQVFTDNRCLGAFLCGVSAVAAAMDCAVELLDVGRTAAEPYGAAACLALAAAKWGVSLESRGMYDALRTAALDRNPPWLVTDTDKGNRKQPGALPGFYTSIMRRNFSALWQTPLAPLILAASLVFAALSSLGQDRGADFFLNWSAILAAGATWTLPLCWGLPWARLSRRLNQMGCALAGWSGAEQLGRRKKMIVTDGDLFPPGSVAIEGITVHDIEAEKAASYAASMARCSGCVLERVFDQLLRSEGGQYLPVQDFQFYQEGGFSGAIQEEDVLFGTESFLLKMGIHLGDASRPHTGMYLSVGGRLAATFSLRYDPAENVDYALGLMRRSRVTAILASRDPNVTPKLLQRKFQRKLRVEYPSLTVRVALSEPGKRRAMPRALLLREGLLPYAGAVVGGRRLCRGVRRATELALFGSAAGTLLAFYLVFQARYNLLTPLNLILFLLLWAVPVLLVMDLS